MTYYDDVEKFVPSAAIPVDGSSVQNPLQPITYDLYASFWKLQSCFVSNVKTFEAPLWSEFMDLAKKTFELFDTFNFTSSSSDSKHDGSAYLSNKYLTSSQV